MEKCVKFYLFIISTMLFVQVLHADEFSPLGQKCKFPKEGLQTGKNCYKEVAGKDFDEKKDKISDVTDEVSIKVTYCLLKTGGVIEDDSTYDSAFAGAVTMFIEADEKLKEKINVGIGGCIKQTDDPMEFTKCMYSTFKKYC